MSKLVAVLYSCSACGIKDRSVTVNARREEGVVEWVEYMGNKLSRDHDIESPHCKITSLSEVKIPIEGTDRVGGPKQVH